MRCSFICMFLPYLSEVDPRWLWEVTPNCQPRLAHLRGWLKGMSTSTHGQGFPSCAPYIGKGGEGQRGTGIVEESGGWKHQRHSSPPLTCLPFCFAPSTSRKWKEQRVAHYQGRGGEHWHSTSSTRRSLASPAATILCPFLHSSWYHIL